MGHDGQHDVRLHHRGTQVILELQPGRESEAFEIEMIGARLAHDGEVLVIARPHDDLMLARDMDGERSAERTRA